MRLSFLVAFSSGFGYALGAVNFNWTIFSMLFLGGFLVSGASITINQIIEKDVYRFHQAAIYHRDYTLKQLLPKHGIAVL